MLHIERAQISVLHTREEIHEGMQFLESKYRNAFDVAPSAPDCLIGARVGTAIVGTIGVNFGNERELRLTRIYSFDHSLAPLPVDTSRTVEIGRWACTTDGISARLAETAVLTSLARKMRYGWCEHALPLHRVCRRFGVVFYPVDARLQPARIEPCYVNYYASHATHLYMFDLEQAREGLQQYLSR